MCTKTYVGADTTWTSIKGTVIENKKKKEAITECSSFDKSTTLLTETLTIKCEIK